ncbi:hypothetical protein A6A19_07700 [Actinobacillus delphinicola]|uniref:Uncharacterized protein n=2 Tax=Actinobacillus delphinicola TaxID=51161 RepID=A0A448TTP5_9PAST|nr:hypothetical protein [Actinobacillus delphinicola]VEJ09369.1 Uncharacterised protein [Actinobacillus delphinicola]
MHLIKFSTSSTKYYPIELELYMKKTHKLPQFRLENSNGEFCYLAICPACNNPVQIINLYRTAKNTDKPYGKHIPKTIPHLAHYNEVAYLCCPYRAKKIKLDKSERRNPSDFDEGIVHNLVYHFDKIIYFFEQKVGIKVSESLAKTLLKDFFAHRVYRYVGTHSLNLPIMIMYFLGRQRLIGRKVSNVELCHAIEDFTQIDEKTKKLTLKGHKFCDIGFSFRNHKRHVMDNEFIESILLEITLTDGSTENTDVLYKQKITLDSQYIANLYNYEPRLPEWVKERNATLIALAKQVALSYGFNV